MQVSFPDSGEAHGRRIGGMSGTLRMGYCRWLKFSTGIWNTVTAFHSVSMILDHAQN